jgi:catecholate siderophore receptor
MTMSLTTNKVRFPLRAAVQQVLGTQNERPAAREAGGSTVISAPSLALGAIAACLALSPLTSRAQQTTPEEKTLPTVKVQDEGEAPPAATQIGKTPQLLRDIPQTITVIDRAVMDAQGATTLTDVLRNVPGITLSAGEGGNIGDNVNLRGFSARTDLYMDGIRDRAQYSRETFFLESVEVLKGPSSMLFGRGSTGGVINQVSKQPRRQAATEVSGSVGTDSYYRLTADWNQPISETTAVRVAAFGHTNDSTRDVVGSERYGIAPSVRFGMGTPTEITLSAIVQRRDDIPDYGFALVTSNGQVATKDNLARPLDRDHDIFYGFTNDSFVQDVDMASVRISHEFSQALTLRNQTQFNSARIDANPTRINVTPADYLLDRGVRQHLARDVEDQSLFNQTDLIAHLGTGSIRHTIIAGAEIGRDTYENQTYTTNGLTATVNLTNPPYGPMPASAVIVPNVYTDNVGDTLAVYVNEQLDVGDHWKFIAGLRWDQFKFDTYSTNASNVVTADTTKTDDMTSVRAGVVYQPDLIQTYYVSYGTSFNPSAETLTSNTANLNVDPEENRSFEVGGKWSFAEGKLLITSALFRVDKTNARTNDPFLGVTLDGETRVEGFELGVSGNITDAWMMLAGYTYLDGTIVKLTETGTNGGVRDGNTLPNTPEHNVSLWTTYNLPHGWQVGGGLVYATERLLNNANTAIVDGYTRMDATVAYVTNRYTVRMNLLNLTNQEYFEVASAGRATPAQSATALATIAWKF